MASVNKVILVGHLGRDPELRYNPSGVAFCSVSLATSRQWKNRESGERQEETEWHRVVFSDRLAEVAGEYLKKGSAIYVEGRLRTRKWQDKDGRDQYTTEVIANQMQMLGGRESGGGSDDERGSRDSGGGRGSTNRGQPARHGDRTGGAYNKPSSGTGFDDMDDDLPF